MRLTTETHQKQKSSLPNRAYRLTSVDGLITCGQVALSGEKMKGTEKQIAWVEQIKTKALEMLTPYMDKIKTSVPRNDLEAQDKANALQVIDKLHTCDDATWYIDHVRHYLTAQEILTAAARDGDLIAHLS